MTCHSDKHGAGLGPEEWWAEFWRPVRWVVLFHALLLVLGIVLLSLFPNQESLWVFGVSLVMAQMALLMIWTLLGTAGMFRLLAVRYLVPLASLLALALVATFGAPAWLLGASFLLMSTFVALMVTLSKGLRLEHFNRAAMPPSRDFQFSVRSTLLAAVCVAALFGLRGIPAMLGGLALNVNGFVAALVIVIMMVVVLALLVSAPLVALWAALTPGKVLPRLLTALIGWGLGAVLVYHFVHNTGKDVPPMLIPSATVAGSTLILLATLLVLRVLRYRVVWERQ